MNTGTERTRSSEYREKQSDQTVSLFSQERFLQLQRYAEGISAALWLLAVGAIWARIILANADRTSRDLGFIDQIFFVALMVSIAIQLFILIVRASRIKREPGWELSHRIKRWAILGAMGLFLLGGGLFTLFVRFSQSL